jgi:predicted Rossmann fold nucleotide-binding protein DprA/Smf involved in DNA uptake
MYELLLNSLLLISGIPNLTKFQLALYFPKWVTDKQKLYDYLQSNSSISVEEFEHIYSEALNIHASSKSLGFSILGPQDSQYPQSLLKLPLPPFVLFVNGELSCLTRPTVAIIGSNKPTEYTLLSTNRVAYRFAENKVSVIKILNSDDNQEIESCLSFTSSVIGIINSSNNSVNIANKILEGKGCILSLYPPGKTNSVISNAKQVEETDILLALSNTFIVIDAEVVTARLK